MKMAGLTNTLGRDRKVQKEDEGSVCSRWKCRIIGMAACFELTQKLSEYHRRSEKETRADDATSFWN